MKKGFIRTLLIVFGTLLFSTSVFAQYFQYGGINYSIIDENSVSVSNGSGYASNIEIPSKVTYNGREYVVTSISNAAFDRCKKLVSVTIPSSVISIGSSAFRGCTKLSSVTFPNTMIAIDGSAFTNTSWLSNQPNGLVYAGKMVYKYKGTMSANASITIKNGTIGIADSAFYNCNNMTHITIPNSVIKIGKGSFSRCSGLTSISIPNSVTSIGSYAFNGCSNLTTVTIPSSVISIGFNAFNGTPWYNNQAKGLVYAGNVAYKYKGDMPSKTTITIKSGTLGIADYAFSGCSGLRSVTIPNSVICIGGSAFSGCSDLTSITIPNSVTEIGNNAFQECSGLTSVDIPNSVITIKEGAFRYCENLKSVSIPNSVLSIGPSAFYNCSKLTSIDIPNSITSIASWTFEKCSSLTSVTIPNSVTSIGYSAFEACSSLTSITIPERVKSIGAYAFVDCSSLSSFSFPNSLTSVGYDAFKGTSWYDSQPDGLVYAGKVAYKYKGTMPTSTHVSIKDGTILIADNAFSSCSGLTSVTIPNSVTSIGGSAFSKCSGLTSISLPNSVTEIGGSAFSSCTGLTSVTIPNKVTFIHRSTFYGCSSLGSVFLPYGLISIDGGVFSSCSSLTSIIIPGSVTSIGRAFYGCKSLKKVVSEIERPFVINDTVVYDMPSNVELIVPYGTRATYLATEGWEKFQNILEATNPHDLADDKGLLYKMKSNGTLEVVGLSTRATTADIFSEVTISGRTYQVTSIGERAFEGRSDLTYLSIPWSVTSIGEYAFIDCGSNITVNIADPESWCAMELGNEHSSPLSSAGKVLVFDIETTNINIPEGVTSIGNFTFYQCRSITSLTIPSSVKSIGSSAFEDCTDLTSLTLSEGLEYIGGSTFEGCTGLNVLRIPSTTNAISINAFKNCTGVTDVFCYANNVPDTDENAFDGTPTEKSTLYVLGNAINDYKNTWPWSDFKNFVALDGNYLKSLVDFIMGKNPEGINKNLADLNGDKKANAADVVKLVNLINK